MEPTTILAGIEAIELVAGVLAANTVVTEALPFVKKVKANSTLQLIWSVFKAFTKMPNKVGGQKR